MLNLPKIVFYTYMKKQILYNLILKTSLILSNQFDYNENYLRTYYE